MDFYVGQKVVCINDEWDKNKMYWIVNVPNKPKKGSVYTIREIKPKLGYTAFLLHELINPKIDWLNCTDTEGGFKSHRFRPVIERKTDISVFNQIINDASKKIEKV